MGSNSSKLAVGLAVVLYVTYTQNQTLQIQLDHYIAQEKEKQAPSSPPAPPPRLRRSEVSPTQRQRCLEEAQKARLKQVPGQQRPEERKIEIKDDDAWMDGPVLGSAGKKKASK